MSILRRARPRPVQTEKRSTFSIQQLALQMGAVEGSLGVSSVDEALRDAATWACVKVKAQGMASLPVDVVRYEGKTRIQVSPVPLVIARPSGVVRRRVWMFQGAASMFTDGNVFGLVMAVDSMARPLTIELVNPSTCKERKVVDGVPQVSINNVVHRRFPFGDLWHLSGEMVEAGSPFGLSPIQYGSKSIATALAAEAFGGTFFTEGGHPSAILAPETDPGPEGAKAIKQSFVNATRGTREPAVLPQTIKYEKIQIDPNDSQFLDLMQFEVLQACRRHSVPPSMVFAAVAGQNVTYANVTQADLHFLKHSLSYPIDLFEEAQSDLLPMPRVVKYNRDAILRADASGRWAVHDIRLKNRTTSVNEVRALEDEEPFGDEFDEPGIPPLAGAELPPSADVPTQGGAV